MSKFIPNENRKTVELTEKEHGVIYRVDPNTSPFTYNAWPTICKDENEKLYVACSGHRAGHLCPFGKNYLFTSTDNGNKWSAPTIINDTYLDDRDAGVLSFGENGVIVTSFNNTIKFQRDTAQRSGAKNYILSYLDTLSEEDEKRYLGSTFRVSFDGGITFGELYKSPISSPHGPIQRKNGDIIWVGRTFSDNDTMMENDCICAYLLHPENGKTEYLGRVDDVIIDGEKQLSCEPYAFELDDGSLICHIRVQTPKGESKLFTTYQTMSADGGMTWSAPKRILSEFGGAPAHIMLHSSGTLISVYGFRGSPITTKPYGIKAMFSRDGGKTWDTDHIIYTNEISHDLGYPSTVELSDGSLLTVFYAKEKEDSPAVIMQQKWRFAY
jgi:hypothetical protein